MVCFNADELGMEATPLNWQFSVDVATTNAVEAIDVAAITLAQLTTFRFSQ